MKTVKALFIDNGIIKAGEFPVEPIIIEVVGRPKGLTAFKQRSDYQQALASAKANAVECEDQEEALGVVIISCPSDCILLRGLLVIGAKDGIYPLPSGWDYRVEAYKIGRSVKDKDGIAYGYETYTEQVAKLYRTEEQPEPEESQERTYTLKDMWAAFYAGRVFEVGEDSPGFDKWIDNYNP